MIIINFNTTSKISVTGNVFFGTNRVLNGFVGKLAQLVWRHDLLWRHLPRIE